jgi:hypothetical protein
MIKAFFRWLFKAEYLEAQLMLQKAKEIKPAYVKYDVLNIKSFSFLTKMQDIMKSPEFKFWLAERQREYDRLVKYSTVTNDFNRSLNIGRSMAIDDLLSDLEMYNKDYLILLNTDKEAANAE